MNLDQARFFMVEQQIRPWDVLDPKILTLLMTTPRHLFVEKTNEKLAYSDLELPIGEGQAMMYPRIEGRLLQALDIDSSESVLEIGTGSGYLAALIASSAKNVTTVELHKLLQEVAQARLTNFENIDFQIGDASKNWDDGKVYNAIILTGSVASIPQAYKEKLTLGGRLAVIAGHSPVMMAQVLTRIGNQEWEVEVLFETDLKALINAGETASFKF